MILCIYLDTNLVDDFFFFFLCCLLSYLAS